MPNEPKKKLAGPRAGEVNETILFEFASLADMFGFHTKEIQGLLQRDPDREMIYRFLRTARKPDQYRYENLEDCIARVVSVIHEAEPLQDNEDDVMDLEVDEREKPPNRCGVPNNADQLRDQSSTFLNKLHGPIERQDTSLTSFFIQRSIYFSFFGQDTCIGFDDLEDLHEGNMFNLTHRAQGQREPAQFTKTREDRQLEEQQIEVSALEAEERGYHERLQITRGEAQELDARLRSLTTKRQEQEVRLEDLERILPKEEERLKWAATEAQNLENHLQRLKNDEIDQTRKLDQIKVQQQKYQQNIRLKV